MTKCKDCKYLCWECDQTGKPIKYFCCAFVKTDGLFEIANTELDCSIQRAYNYYYMDSKMICQDCKHLQKMNTCRLCSRSGKVKSQYDVCDCGVMDVSDNRKDANGFYKYKLIIEKAVEIAKNQANTKNRTWAEDMNRLGKTDQIENVDKKEGEKPFVVCSKCNLYMIDAQGYTRKDENTLVKEHLPVNYCPKCGNKLNV